MKADYCRRLAHWILTERDVGPLRDLLGFEEGGTTWDWVKGQTEEKLAENLFSEVTEAGALYLVIRNGISLEMHNRVMALLDFKLENLKRHRKGHVPISPNTWNTLQGYCAEYVKGTNITPFPCWPTPSPPPPSPSMWEMLLEE